MDGRPVLAATAASTAPLANATNWSAHHTGPGKSGGRPVSTAAPDAPWRNK